VLQCHVGELALIRPFARDAVKEVGHEPRRKRSNVGMASHGPCPRCLRPIDLFKCSNPLHLLGLSNLDMSAGSATCNATPSHSNYIHVPSIIPRLPKQDCLHEMRLTARVGLGVGSVTDKRQTPSVLSFCLSLSLSQVRVPCCAVRVRVRVLVRPQTLVRLRVCALPPRPFRSINCNPIPP